MGCSIHGYIEYKEMDNAEYWNFGENYGTRDYRMFGILANVRGTGCIFEPRGIPRDISWRTKNDYCLFVVDEENDSDGVTSKEYASRWLEHKLSEWWDTEHKWITHPDWHSPSWLTADEFEKVLLVRKGYTDWECSPEWDAILASMKVLPNSRFVFWFDN